MKIWIGYASSHSLSVTIVGTFAALDGATEVCALVDLLDRVTHEGEHDGEAVVRALAPLGLDDLARDIVLAQHFVRPFGDEWPGFSTEVETSESGDRVVVHLRIAPEFQFNSPVARLTAPLEALLRRLGAEGVTLDYDS